MIRRHGNFLLPLAALLVFAAPFGDAQGAVAGNSVYTKTLDNGLRVVILPDSDIPQVSMSIWYRVGVRNDVIGKSGLAHYFEHMMFNGTAQRPKGEFDQEIEAAGGSATAYTLNDATVFHNTFPKDALETVLRLEADRMVNLNVTDEAIESERGVVLSERRSNVENSMLGAAYEQMRATSFVAHPYQLPILGWEADIRGWTKSDLETFYRAYYAASNATIVLVGDVGVASTLQKIGDIFGPLPKAEIRHVEFIEPEQQGPKRVEIRRKSLAGGMLMMGWRAGREAEQETLALRILFEALAGGPYSRLPTRLAARFPDMEQVQTYIDVGLDPGLAILFVPLSPKVHETALELAIEKEVKVVVEEGLTSEELEIAKKRLLLDYWKKMSTITGKAELLAHYDRFYNNPRGAFEFEHSLMSITPAQLLMAARKRLVSTGKTVSVVTGELALAEGAK